MRAMYLLSMLLVSFVIWIAILFVAKGQLSIINSMFDEISVDFVMQKIKDYAVCYPYKPYYQ